MLPSLVLALALSAAPKPTVSDGRVPKGVTIAKVEAYSFNAGTTGPSSRGFCAHLIKSDQTRCATAGPAVVLSEVQRDKLLAMLQDKSTFLAGDSSCWNPHHAFVLSDSAGVPVTQVNVCFECEQVSRRGAMSPGGRAGFFGLFVELGLAKAELASPSP